MGRRNESLVIMDKDIFSQYEVHDRVKLLGWDFLAIMTVSKKLGLASALQGGRIIEFVMYQDGEPVCLYDDGKWYKKIDDENDIAHIAFSYFMARNNRRRSKKEEKERHIL